MKLNLGVGTIPVHQQHQEIMDRYGKDWQLVDLYRKDPAITNWDATALPVDDNSVEVIYCSHLLEHIPHVDTTKVLKHWYDKLISGGTLILNVPDIEWACKMILKYASGAVLDGYYDRWEGEHGLLSVVYGTQSSDGEYHKAGFTVGSLTDQLKKLGFVVEETKQFIDAHDMGVIYLVAKK